MRSLREIALEEMLDTGAVMAQEIIGIDDDVEESSGDAADVSWMRKLAVK
jgi:hypothetical protein